MEARGCWVHEPAINHKRGLPTACPRGGRLYASEALLPNPNGYLWVWSSSDPCRNPFEHMSTFWELFRSLFLSKVPISYERPINYNQDCLLYGRLLICIWGTWQWWWCVVCIDTGWPINSDTFSKAFHLVVWSSDSLGITCSCQCVHGTLWHCDIVTGRQSWPLHVLNLEQPCWETCHLQIYFGRTAVSTRKIRWKMTIKQIYFHSF